MDIKRKAFVKDKSMDDCVIFMTPRDGYFVMTTNHNYYDFVHCSISNEMTQSSKMRSQMIDRFVPGRINDKKVIEEDKTDDENTIDSSWGNLFQGSRRQRTWPPPLNCSFNSRIFQVVWPAHDKSGWKESLLDVVSTKLLGGFTLDGSFKDAFESFCDEEERVLCSSVRLLSKWYRMASNIVQMKMPGTWLFLRRYHHENTYDDWKRAEKEVTSVEIFETERLREVIPKIAPALVKLRLSSVVDRLCAMELACNRLLNDHSNDAAAVETNKTNGGNNSPEKDELEIALKSRDKAMALYKHWETRHEKASATHKSCMATKKSCLS